MSEPLGGRPRRGGQGDPRLEDTGAGPTAAGARGEPAGAGRLLAVPCELSPVRRREPCCPRAGCGEHPPLGPLSHCSGFREVLYYVPGISVTQSRSLGDSEPQEPLRCTLEAEVLSPGRSGGSAMGSPKVSRQEFFLGPPAAPGGPRRPWACGRLSPSFSSSSGDPSRAPQSPTKSPRLSLIGKTPALGFRAQPKSRVTSCGNETPTTPGGAWGLDTTQSRGAWL